MKRIVCKSCGRNDFKKTHYERRCRFCGTSYDVEPAPVEDTYVPQQVIAPGSYPMGYCSADSAAPWSGSSHVRTYTADENGWIGSSRVIR